MLCARFRYNVNKIPNFVYTDNEILLLAIIIVLKK